MRDNGVEQSEEISGTVSSDADGEAGGFLMNITAKICTGK